MEVKVGDWVRFRGGTRIYEVNDVKQPRNGQTVIHVIGRAMPALAEHVEQVAPKFWIKRSEE